MMARPLDPVACAIGRLFAIASRPFQPGDIETYEACRAVVMAHAGEPGPDTRPNWARDRLRGAAGD